MWVAGTFLSLGVQMQQSKPIKFERCIAAQERKREEQGDAGGDRAGPVFQIASLVQPDLFPASVVQAMSATSICFVDATMLPTFAC